MADYKATDTEFTLVANAIRAKGGTQEQLQWPGGFSNAVENLPSSSTLGTKTVSENGTYNALDDNLDGYSKIQVDVPSGGKKGVADFSGEIYTVPYAHEAIMTYTRSGATGTKATSIFGSKATSGDSSDVVVFWYYYGNAVHYRAASKNSGRIFTRDEEGSISSYNLSGTYTFNGETVYYCEATPSGYAYVSNVEKTMDYATVEGGNAIDTKKAAWAAIYGAGGLES